MSQLQNRSVEDMRECLKVAEQLAQMSLASGVPCSRRGRKAILQQGVQHPQDNGTQTQDSVTPYVPPKQLLQYLVR